MAAIDSTKGMGDYFALLRRRKVYLLTILPSAVFLSVCLAYGLPAKYRATATILIEQPAVSQKVVASTVDANLGSAQTQLNIPADAQIELMRRRALSTDELKALVSRIDPYPEENGPSTAEKARPPSMIERTDASASAPAPISSWPTDAVRSATNAPP